MFTGLVESMGVLRESRSTPEGARLGIEHGLGRLELGESIAVNGVCLTVVDQSPERFSVDVSQETLRVTSLSRAVPGSPLNLERALQVGERLGGHLVSGHVDGEGVVDSMTPSGTAMCVGFRAPRELLVYIASKGSITIDGVSLTVNAVKGERFEVMLIPHTRQVTTLGELRPGSRVNLEVDLLARYVKRALEFDRELGATTSGAESLGAALKKSGLM